MAHNPPSVTVRAYTKIHQHAASFKAGNITLGKFKELVFDAFAESGAFNSPAASMYNYMTGSGEGPSKTGALAEGQWNLPNDYKVGSQPPAAAAAPVAPQTAALSPFGSVAFGPSPFGSVTPGLSPFGSTPSGPSPFEQPATAASLRDAETQRIINEMLRNDAARIQALQGLSPFGAGPSLPSPFGSAIPGVSPFGVAPSAPSPFASAAPIMPNTTRPTFQQPTNGFAYF
jgi:hypothetical protein